MRRNLPIAQPESLEQLTALLETHGDQAKIVAGGTALAILLRNGLLTPEVLIWLGRVPGLDAITVEDDTLVLQAGVTHRIVETDAMVRSRMPFVANVFGTVGNVRVRNVATVGGVIAEADYASDPPTAFLLLDADVELASRAGVRRVPYGDFQRDFYETVMRDDEVVTAVRIPIPPPDAALVYEKVRTRSSEDRPCLGVAVMVRLDDRGTCDELRVSVGAATAAPVRLRDVEAGVRGVAIDEGAATAVAEAYADAIEPIDDVRASSWYRTEMVRVWVRRAIVRAADQAGRNPVAAGA